MLTIARRSWPLVAFGEALHIDLQTLARQAHVPWPQPQPLAGVRVETRIM
jgi:hypothetical protein